MKNTIAKNYFDVVNQGLKENKDDDWLRKNILLIKEEGFDSKEILATIWYLAEESQAKRIEQILLDVDNSVDDHGVGDQQESEIQIAENESVTESSVPTQDAKETKERKWACYLTYWTYGLGLLAGPLAAIGIVAAHLETFFSKKDGIVRSHAIFQVVTFWAGLPPLIIVMGIAWTTGFRPIVLLWMLWALVRVVKGGVILSNGKKIINPTTLLFPRSEEKEEKRWTASSEPENEEEKMERWKREAEKRLGGFRY